MWADRPLSYPVYLLRRFMRIYLPFAAAAVLSIFGASLFHSSEPHISAWFGLTWHTRPTARLIFDQFLMSPNPVFNTAFWSLRFELQLSILMPAIVWVMKRANPLAVTVCSLLLAFLYPVRLLAWHSHYLVGYTVQIGSLFVLGAALAVYRTTLRLWMRQLGVGGWAVLLFSLMLYVCYPLQMKAGYAGDLGPRYMLMAGLGAAGIIVCALELEPFAKALMHGTVEYLGEVSYSLYLVHSMVIFTVFGLLYGRVNSAILNITIALFALGAAHLFYLGVEKPCIRLSKRLRSRTHAGSPFRG